MTYQKVKPAAAVMILLMSLLWIAIFYSKEVPMPRDAAPRRDERAAVVRAEASKEAETHPAPEKSEARRQIEAMRERTDFLANSAAILMTEDVQHGMVNKAVSRLEQAYQPWFSKWAVIESDRKALLDVIRARESRLISIRVAAQKEGVDAMLTSRKVIAAESAAYAQEISELLGDEKMSELAQVDKTVHEQAIATLKASLKK